jgi:hypothetical protein
LQACQKTIAYLLPAVIVNSTFLSLNTVVAKLNKNSLKHKKILLVIIVIAVLAAGFWVYGQASTYTNKRDFQQAKKMTDNIYNSIILKVGTPDNFSKKDTCSRSYQEFNGYGQINCDIDRSILYSVSNKEDAQEKINEIQSIINQVKDYVPTRPINTTIVTTGVLNKSYYGVQNFYKLKNLDCTSKYVYNTPDDTFLKLNHPGTPLYVVIGCTGPAKKLYYPLNQ